MSGFEFKQGDNISKEEFLAQFGDETEEFVIKVFLASLPLDTVSNYKIYTQAKILKKH